MKSVLFVGYYYPPVKAIGTLRNLNVSQQLIENGYKLHILTTSNSIILDKEQLTIPSGVKIRKLPTFDYQTIRWLLGVFSQPSNRSSEQKKTQPTFLSKLLNSFPFNLLLGEGGGIYIIAGIFWGIMRLKKTDYIYSSFRPYSDHVIAWFLKTINPSLVWVADFRDIHVDHACQNVLWPSVQDLVNTFFFKKADVPITVSRGYLNGNLDSYNKKFMVVRNGYSEITKRKIDSAASTSHGEFFTIAHCGALYGGRRNPSLLFEALSNLIEKGLIEKKHLKAMYAGTEGHAWSGFLSKFGLESINDDRGKISLNESLNIQKNSSINLLLTWADQNGGSPAKFYEYLIAGRPIILLVNGTRDSPVSKEFEEIFDYAKPGIIVYDTKQNRTGEREKLENYILGKYQEWKQEGCVSSHVPEELIEKFHWKNIILSLIDAMEKAKKQNGTPLCLLLWATLLLSTLSCNKKNTPMQNRKMDMEKISVLSYGAVPDDNTDDTMAFQQAMDEATHGTIKDVFIPSGTYNLKLVKIYPGIRISGEKGTILKRMPNVGKWGRMFTTHLSPYVGTTDSPILHINDIVFDGNIEEQGAYKKYEIEQQHLLFLNASPDSYGKLRAVINGCSFNNCAADGVSIYNNTDVLIQQCTASDVFRGAITVTGGNAIIKVNGFTTFGPNIPTGIDIEVDGKGYGGSSNVQILMEDISLEGKLDIAFSDQSVFLGNNIVTKYPFLHIFSPESRVYIKDSYFQTPLHGYGRIMFPNNVMFENCTFELVTAPGTNGEGERSAISIYFQTGYKKARNQRLRFNGCSFVTSKKLGESAPANAILLLPDEINNDNSLILDNVFIDSTFSKGILIKQGGQVSITGGMWGAETAIECYSSRTYGKYNFSLALDKLNLSESTKLFLKANGNQGDSINLEDISVPLKNSSVLLDYPDKISIKGSRKIKVQGSDKDKLQGKLRLPNDEFIFEEQKK
jgi:hypothetical protein